MRSSLNYYLPVLPTQNRLGIAIYSNQSRQVLQHQQLTTITTDQKGFINQAVDRLGITIVLFYLQLFGSLALWGSMNKPNYTYMKATELQTKDNLERLLLENAQLKHRLACVKDDIEIIDRHIASYKKCRKWFKQPSLNKDGTIYAEEAWHNITNIEIACDLSDESPLEWITQANSFPNNQ